MRCENSTLSCALSNHIISVGYALSKGYAIPWFMMTAQAHDKWIEKFLDVVFQILHYQIRKYGNKIFSFHRKIIGCWAHTRFQWKELCVKHSWCNVFVASENELMMCNRRGRSVTWTELCMPLIYGIDNMLHNNLKQCKNTFSPNMILNFLHNFTYIYNSYSYS